MQRARTRGVVRGWKGTNPRTMRAALSGSYRRNGGARGRQANDDRVGIKQGAKNAMGRKTIQVAC